MVLWCSFPHKLIANYVDIHIHSELGIILCEFLHNYILKLCGFQHKLYREHFADYVEYHRANNVADHNISFQLCGRSQCQHCHIQICGLSVKILCGHKNISIKDNHIILCGLPHS